MGQCRSVLFRGLVLVSAVVAASACASSSNVAGVVAPESDGGPGVIDASNASHASSDAASSADGTGTGGCEGPCRSTSLRLNIGGNVRTLVRAQFGTQQGDGGIELHTESHLGGNATCPDANSPSPDYTFIVTALPRTSPAAGLDEHNGVIATLFDFKGDLGLQPVTKTIHVVVRSIQIDPSSTPTWVAFDVDAFFREGDLKGHVFAQYCPSLND